MILLCDVGSTYTKLTVVDDNDIIASARAFTTVKTNIIEGYKQALYDIKHICDTDKFNIKLAASSAAGGLKMVSSGLVPDLTAKASRLAAASAGAKVIKTYSYELTKFDCEEIEHIAPDIILLSGGIDGGNKDVLLKNAESIANIQSNFCVIIAGNRSAAYEAHEILGKKQAVICENVMPSFGKLNIEPAKNAIRDLFIKNIISAKGLNELQAEMSDEIIPTPLAVFDAAKLLSERLGPLMVCDLGGATTDVYSMADGISDKKAYIQGLIEPYAKRTVEGDIGMRYSLRAMLDLAEFPDYVKEWANICESDPSVIAREEHEKKAEEIIAYEAIRLSSARHVGFIEKAYTPIGETLIQTGKDLSSVKYIIGTGGAIINSPDILKAAKYSPSDLNLLKPQNPIFLIDKKYCMAAMGLLAQKDPDLAYNIMEKNLMEVITIPGAV